MKSFFLATVAAATLLATLPAAAQFQKPEDAVKYRKAGMFMMNTHMGRLAAMAQGRVPFDGAAAAASGEALGHLSLLPYLAFIDSNSGAEPSRAKANIWTERAKFDAAAKKLQEEAAKLAVAAKANNPEALKAAFGATAGACKACHDDFRNP
jgi:cytochrome c556